MAVHRKNSFLDKMVGNLGGGGKGRRGYGAGPLARPSSVNDINEIDEDGWSINQMPDNEILTEFEKMLTNMNLSEEKKQPLLHLPLAKKREMLSMNSRNMARTKFQSPVDYIEYLSGSDLSLAKKYSCIESLRVALTNNSLDWIQEFGTRGLKQVLSLLNECFRNDSKWDKVQYECIKCLKAYMNNKVGLKDMFEHKEALTLLARSIMPNLPHVMQEATKLMAAVCIVPPDGHDKTLEAITIAGELRNSGERFAPIVQGLLINHNEQLRTNCMALINSIITTPDELDFRMHLRNEFMRVGLVDILDTIKLNPTEELQVQLKVFNDNKEEDFDEFAQRFDNIRLELDDMNDCFELLKNTVEDTPAEPFFLSILQHMICIRDDMYIRPAYYKLIEECVAQIVLHKSGMDPDFRATKRFQIDVDPLIETLVERSRHDEESHNEGMKSQLEDALTKRHETEAKLGQAETRIAQLEEALRSGVGSPTKLSVPPGLVIAKPMGKPIEINVGIPPPPPPILSGTSAGLAPPPPPPPPPGSMFGSGPPPPPPPPLPSGGGPPPPPPPPGGLRIPMHPGGGVTPPPLPGFKEEDIFMKLGIKRKKKWNLENPTKRTNWKQVPAQRLTKSAFWAQVDEERFASQTLVENLMFKFGTKPLMKEDQLNGSQDGFNGSNGTLMKKKTKELKVLDPKAAQNLSILLGGALKHISYEELRMFILKCDTQVLTENLLQSLIQYIPTPDQLNRLKEYEKEYDDLAEAEQFAISISGIKRLVPRLKSLMFKIRYKELVQDCKPDIVAATAACEEIRKSKKFAKILELILLIGNIMNSGTKNAQSVGFDISYLTKLSNTKDRENKTTLLHFLVEYAERDFPEILNFYDELMHLDSAARVSIDSIQKVLKQMDSSIKNLETDLKNAQRSPLEPDDRFLDAMGSFCGEARSQCDILQAMATKMESLYSDLAEYFVFDVQKYSLEEFMTDIRTFKTQFKQSHDNILKEREAAEKQVRAREAREKQERERADRAAKKRALVDFNAPDDQEGVMDSLLEALKTGSAFNREQKRKRAPRAAGAERRAQLNRSRSRGPNGIGSGSPHSKDIVDIILEDEENDPNPVPSGSRQSRATRRPRPAIQSGREREFTMVNGETDDPADDSDPLIRRLRHLNT